MALSLFLTFFLILLSDFPRLKTLLGATISITLRIDSNRISSSNSWTFCSLSEYLHSDKLCSPKVFESDEISKDDLDLDNSTSDDDIDEPLEDDNVDEPLKDDDVDEPLEDDDGDEHLEDEDVEGDDVDMASEKRNTSER